MTSDTLTQVLKNFGEVFAGQISGAHSDPREDVLIRYTHGNGKTSADKKYITLKMYMYTPDGAPDGWHEGVWERMFNSPEELLLRPSPPPPPLNQPVGPVADIPPVAFTKGIWTFGDDSSVTAVGPALSHLMPLDDQSGLFMVTCAQIIAGGQGRYAGARGLKTSLGSTWSTKNIFTEPGEVEFVARTIDTFRIMKAQDIK